MTLCPTPGKSGRRGRGTEHERGEGGKRQLQAADQHQLLPILGRGNWHRPWGQLVALHGARPLGRGWALRARLSWL